MASGQNPRAGLLMDDDPLILTQSPSQLIGPTIHRVNPFRTATEQDIGKTACAAANVNRGHARHIKFKMVQTMVQLQTAPGNPRMILTFQINFSIR